MEKMKFSEFQKTYKDTEHYKKLKKLRIVKRWFNNAINHGVDKAVVENITGGYSFNRFISRSFIWNESPEGHTYWFNISKK